MTQHLYVDNKESELSFKGDCLQIKVPNRPLASVPIHMLSQVTVLANVTLTANFIHKLASSGIGISFVNLRSKGEITDCINLQHGNHQRRLNQYKLVLNKRACLVWARYLVGRKITTQIRQIYRYSQTRLEVRGSANRSIGRIKEIRNQVKYAEIEQLLGLEGAASREYFSMFKQVIPDGLGFNGRNKRPPKDPVNALLSLTYSMLNKECAHALQLVGLDPAYGVYHQTNYSRPSLACDFVEIFRTQADHFVWRLVAEQNLREHHFAKQLNACLLKKEGRQIYFSFYERQLSFCRKRIRKLAARLAKIIDEGGGDDST